MPIFLLDAAADTTTTGGTQWITIAVLVLMLALFYFVIYRPQKKQEKEATAMRDSIKAGDEVITIGGIIGRVVIVKDDKVMIETGNDKTKITFLRSSIKSVETGEDTQEK